MNLESNSHCVVTSKYFEYKTVMDESLSDFQENKQNHRGPKVNQKATKPKHKKVIKRIKGQKDIRTALKKDNNDLVSYAKEFDNICKKSGVDVDSEQLQLAIALSKSLQTEDSDTSTSQSLTSKGRLAKIRTTLQEYGFRVPAAKISTNKKLKKGRKAYKLITITEEERHQKVTGKYAEVLLGCFDSSKLNEICPYNNTAPNFHLASNCPYEFMKDNNIYYVDNLLDKSSSSGYMLRDWAEIPGRPVSPLIFDNSRMDFRELSCSQNELDLILSSSIKSAQNIVATKIKPAIKRQIYDIAENEDVNNKTNKIKNYDNEDCIVNNLEIHLSNKSNMKAHDKDSTNRIEIIDLESNSSFINNDQNRCVSPDLFEDDVSYVMCPSTIITPIKSLSQGQNTKIFTASINNLDFTDCANNSYHNMEKTHLLTSQTKTNRKSDDFMDLTQCAVSASQGIQKETKIDLTKHPDKEFMKLGTTVLPDLNISPKEDTSAKTAILNNKDNKYTKDTLISNNESTLNIVKEDSCIENVEECLQASMCMNNRNKMIEDKTTIPISKDVIDLTTSYKEEKNISITSQTKGSDDELECMDLMQSSRSSACLDELPEIKLDNTKELHLHVDDTIILKEEEYISINDNAKKLITVQDDHVFDLTQDLDEPAEQDVQDKIVLRFYDDFVHDHSDTKENTQNNLVANSVHSINEEIVCIDVVQSPSSMADRPISDESITKTTSSSSLGKKDDNVSIDYDEICEYVSGNQSNTEESLDKEKHESVKSQISNDIHQYDSCHGPALSQQSEIFDLTDKELDYSLHKSKSDMFVDCNLDFGGISVMDNNITGVNTAEYLEKRDSHINKTNILWKTSVSVSENTREALSMNPTDLKDDNPCTISAIKINDVIKSNLNTDALLTPNNSEYLVKTNEVTPMLDYESMTTPQRNKELDKHGLRPFKRKRAIQILTHLYNQTHPVIEPYSDNDHPSPLKKSKLDIEPSCSSPKKLRSPRIPVIYENNKSPQNETIIIKSKSPRKTSENNSKENSPRKNLNMLCIYELSSEVPIIKSLDCNPEDWVFQKKEKGKVPSCRVPLHITFHNYVSSRRSLREAILKYEPVNIDVIHKELVSYGHRYDPKDLLKFLDKKCITVKTADNNARNKR